MEPVLFTVLLNDKRTDFVFTFCRNTTRSDFKFYADRLVRSHVCFSALFQELSETSLQGIHCCDLFLQILDKTSYRGESESAAFHKMRGNDSDRCQIQRFEIPEGKLRSVDSEKWRSYGTGREFER